MINITVMPSSSLGVLENFQVKTIKQHNIVVIVDHTSTDGTSDRIISCHISPEFFVRYKCLDVPYVLCYVFCLLSCLEELLEKLFITCLRQLVIRN